ncbi:hypothetical protein Goshw_003711 [Gossypium schwendimanii]|uniref:Uncharacterized protein n=1 Tax=Gossypium schwendimanii TaxID=34291 RepID=A0A7J9LK91_GOSSC|nr:hypothetical protein [Gossypium schwendimanii]
MNEQEEGTEKLNVNASANQLLFESQSRADEVGQKWFDRPGDLSFSFPSYLPSAGAIPISPTPQILQPTSAPTRPYVRSLSFG